MFAGRLNEAVIPAKAGIQGFEGLQVPMPSGARVVMQGIEGLSPALVRDLPAMMEGRIGGIASTGGFIQTTGYAGSR